MKVCKFEKMKEEDEIRQVINYILKEHPYVVVVPTLTQLQEWLQDISISWFHEEDSASHTTINKIEEYCCTLADHLITDLPLNTDIKNKLLMCAEIYHCADFITSDPVQFPHRYTLKQDIEISGLLTAIMSFGNRKQILKKADELHRLMGD